MRSSRPAPRPRTDRGRRLEPLDLQRSQAQRKLDPARYRARRPGVGGILKGKPLFRQRDKKKDPLPKFDPAMLPTDIAEWFENSARIALNSAVFEVGAVCPSTLAGAPGIEMDFTYATEGDNLERQGTARAAVIGGKLYPISFDAPKIHYYGAGLPTALAIMNSARVVAKGK